MPVLATDGCASPSISAPAGSVGSHTFPGNTRFGGCGVQHPDLDTATIQVSPMCPEAGDHMLPRRMPTESGTVQAASGSVPHGDWERHLYAIPELCDPVAAVAAPAAQDEPRQ